MGAPGLQLERTAAFRVAFPPDLFSGRAAAAAVRGFLAEHRVAEGELFACESCLVEACNNAVEYLGTVGAEKLSGVEAILAPSHIELRVTDHTPGFEWPKRIVLPSEESERGRGLFIIHATMNAVSYLRGADENVLVMRLERNRGFPRSAGSAALSEEEARRQLEECRRTTEGLIRELAQGSEALAMVARWCAVAGDAEEAEDFFGRLLVDIQRLAAADWYVLRLISPVSRELVPVVASRPEWIGQLARPSPSSPVRAFEMIAATSRETVVFDVQHHGLESEPLRAVGKGARGVIWPLCFGGNVIGTLALGRFHADFSVKDLPPAVVKILGGFLALHTRRISRHEESEPAHVMAGELEIGRKIQRALLPSTLPELPGFNLAGGFQSARVIGGDFYDAVALGDDALLMMVADVMGKGLPGALFASHVRGVLRGLSVRTEDPAQVLNRLNRLLFPELSSVGMFVTAVVVVVDLKTRALTAASAGHCPPLYISQTSGEVIPLQTKGVPLGVLPDTVYHSETVSLGTPGLVFLHTDGLTESKNPQGEMWGQGGLAAWLRDHIRPGHSATELRGRLLTELRDFRGGSPPSDDQTFLLLLEQTPG